MSTKPNSYYALRFRSTDDLHQRGDVQYICNGSLYIGQTAECGLQLPSHPDYADTCYAVLTGDKTADGWLLIRQEQSVSITVNGTPLSIARRLHDGDILQFDSVVVRFTEEHGSYTETTYVRHRIPWGLYVLLLLLAVTVSGVIGFLYTEQQRPMTVFADETASVYSIAVDKVMVVSASGDTIPLAADHALIGTGFVTVDGYFVTARHCVECWLAMEKELRPRWEDIENPIVRWAIEAEADPDLRLISQVTISSADGSMCRTFTSEDFLIDYTHDALYDMGDATSSYIWRSVVSQYEKSDAELGDVAVMRWPYGKGTIAAADADHLPEANEKLYCFGFPQNEYRHDAELTSMEGSIFQAPRNAYDRLLCNAKLDPGFSGGPVFTRNGGKRVIGIVSRAEGNRTLVVPAAQVQKLIESYNR